MTTMLSSGLDPRAQGHARSVLNKPVSADPVRAAEELHAEYLSYLEQRVADGDRRVTSLETYLSGLWGVRIRRWVGGRLARRRN